MTDADKLEYLVKKAVEGEWRPDRAWGNVGMVTISEALTGSHDAPPFYKQIIFQHSFAKALFGDKNIEVFGGIWIKDMLKPSTIELHQIDAFLHHLQQAVISDDPIDYLYQAVTKGEQ